MVPAAFKAVVRRAERLGCVRFARISATFSHNDATAQPVAFEGVVPNTLIAAIGNVVGGVEVGAAYWFVYRTPENRA